jgi:PIN domain nuclease of toxin-antitoxin system
MRLLLDTHVLLWALSGDARLKPASRALIAEADAVFVSAASVWEITIKASLGKLTVDLAALPGAIDASGFQRLPVSFEHAIRVAQLPPLHADPFDRLLVAQAQQEPLHLLTADTALVPYSELVRLIT